MIYTGVSFINEPLPTNDFLDDILLRIDGPPEYKILDFSKISGPLFFPEGFGYLTLLVLKDNVNMIILANEQDIMQFYEECDHLTNPELQVYFDNLKGKTVKGNVVEYVDGAIRYNRFEDFCVFLNKTTHDFNIYLIFEKYPYYLPRHDLLNPYYKTCRGR